jgi:hypothetical protein
MSRSEGTKLASRGKSGEVIEIRKREIYCTHSMSRTEGPELAGVGRGRCPCWISIFINTKIHFVQYTIL